MKSLHFLLLAAAMSLGVTVSANTYLTITALQGDTLIKNHLVGVDLIILDVRTATEFVNERIDKARNINYYGAGFNDSLAKLDKNKIYFVYCASGARSNATMNKMRDLNFKMVYNLKDGLPAWKAAGLPTVKGSGSGISPEEVPPILVRVYPNPVSDQAFLEIVGFYQGETTVEILNSIGSTVLRKKLDSDHFMMINARELSPGFYFYRVILPGQILRSGKFQVI
jgi:rhodanese-related sulfurtransferase